MNLICLIPREGGEEDRFVRAASPLFPSDKVEVFRDLGAFAERLHRPRDPSCAVLVVDPSDGDLERFVSLRSFLKDAKILFVLADEREGTIALAHRAMPTYISFLDNGTAGIVTVLKRILRHRTRVPASPRRSWTMSSSRSSRPSTPVRDRDWD